ncbi:hypothetical protein [Streptomyces sp. NPDC058867]|uniref:hypothetical protein n=1 Tax=unclassified Streptomyces TaxID=2593676 RepID=UPI0036AA0CC6
MPRGRHRHSPPLHRLLPPSAIAGVSVVCALGPWAFSEPLVLRGLAAAAAATAIVGAVVMRRWDTHAGKRVADLTRARASDEWRFEERVAELETDLDESRELRGKLEQRLRAKRAELAGLRNEHASLLRRYATAETERATALEGRRLLEIETTTPARALPPAPTPSAETVVEEDAGAVAAPVVDAATEVAPADAEVGQDGTEQAEPTTSAVFSPEGSKLFLRAGAALAKLTGAESPESDTEADGSAAEEAEEPHGAQEAEEYGPAAETGAHDDTPVGSAPEGPSNDTPAQAEVEVEDEPEGTGPAAPVTAGVAAPGRASGEARADVPAQYDGSARPTSAHDSDASAHDASAHDASADDGSARDRAAARSAGPAAQEDEAQGKPEAVDAQEHGHAAAATTTGKPALPAQQPSGHFVAPTAVAVAPTAPVRRPMVEGGFDFFGMQKDAAPADLEAVQNEDLADVVGQEALALHKAESEAEFKPADEESRGVGQVIDLTAHDETEHIDVQGLRSAVS